MTGFFEGATRADALRKKTPDLVADLWLYPIEQGGRKLPGGLGWGCPFSTSKTLGETWDPCPLLGDKEMNPGDQRAAVGFFFHSGELAAERLIAAGKFYLWEERWKGEAIVSGDIPMFA